MVEVDISIIFAGLSIAASILYYASVIRNQNKTQEMQLETRQAQLFMSIYTRANDIEFWKNFIDIQKWEWDSFEDYIENYLSPTEMRAKFDSVGTFFEGMGVMVKRNHIDVTVVDDLMSGEIMSMWQKFEPVIFEERKRKNMPTIWEWFEYLYEEVRKVAEKEHGADHVVDVTRLERPFESDLP